MTQIGGVGAQLDVTGCVEVFYIETLESNVQSKFFQEPNQPVPVPSRDLQPESKLSKVFKCKPISSDISLPGESYRRTPRLCIL